MDIIRKYGIDKLCKLANAHFEKYGRDEKFVEFEDLICNYSRDVMLCFANQVNGADYKKIGDELLGRYRNDKDQEVILYFCAHPETDRTALVEKAIKLRAYNDLVYVAENIEGVDKRKIVDVIKNSSNSVYMYELAKGFPEYAQEIKGAFLEHEKFCISANSNNKRSGELLGKFSNLPGMKTLEFQKLALEDPQKGVVMLGFLETAEKASVMLAHDYMLENAGYNKLSDFSAMRRKLEMWGWSGSDAVAVAEACFECCKAPMHDYTLKNIKLTEQEYDQVLGYMIAKKNGEALVNIVRYAAINQYYDVPYLIIDKIVCQNAKLQMVKEYLKERGQCTIEMAKILLARIGDGKNLKIEEDIARHEMLQLIAENASEEVLDEIEKFLIKNKDSGELLRFAKLYGNKLLQSRAMASFGSANEIIAMAKIDGADVKILYDAVKKRFPNRTRDFQQEVNYDLKTAEDLYDIL